MNAKEFIKLHGKENVEKLLPNLEKFNDQDFIVYVDNLDIVVQFNKEETINIGQLREALKDVTVGSKVMFLGMKCIVVAEKEGTFWLEDGQGRNYFKKRERFTAL